MWFIIDIADREIELARSALGEYVIIWRIMKQFFYFIVGSVVAIALGVSMLGTPALASIGQGGIQGGISAARGEGVPTNLTNGEDSLISKIINILLYAIGVVSVVMLIIGGFRYVISGGQKESVTAAKNTILYAIIGLLIALFAYPIIKFVIDAVTGSSTGTNI